MTAASMTFDEYQLDIPVRTVSHEGLDLQFSTPNEATWRHADQLLTDEAEAIAWIKTFEPGDVFADIGANVGMLAVLAAKTRGCRVIAFEPESQNYALLNHNIFGNGLGDRVTAYCLAISDGVGFDNLYISEFEAGESGHAFGEKLNRKLEPMQPAHAQGCIAATLDGLVEEGILPLPQHIRIDIDGLEHKAIAGARSILGDPQLKSLLIATNQNLDSHRQLVQDLAGLGFVYSQSQADRSLGRQTPFDGAGNFLFFRSEAEAEAVAASLSGATGSGGATIGTDIPPASPLGNGAGNGQFIDTAPNVLEAIEPTVPFSTPIIIDPLSGVAGYSPTEVVDAVMRSIAQAPVELEPFPHFYVERLFPDDCYAGLLEKLPAPELFTSSETPGLLSLQPESFYQLPADHQPFWQMFFETLLSEAFATNLLGKFQQQLTERYGYLGDELQLTAETGFLHDKRTESADVHTDAPAQVTTLLMHLAKDASLPHLGTSICQPKDNALRCPGGQNYPIDWFEKVASLAYRPNTALCILQTDNAFHYTEPGNDGDGGRDLIQYTIKRTSS